MSFFRFKCVYSNLFDFFPSSNSFFVIFYFRVKRKIKSVINNTRQGSNTLTQMTTEGRQSSWKVATMLVKPSIPWVVEHQSYSRILPWRGVALKSHSPSIDDASLGECKPIMIKIAPTVSSKTLRGRGFGTSGTSFWLSSTGKMSSVHLQVHEMETVRQNGRHVLALHNKTRR